MKTIKINKAEFIKEWRTMRKTDMAKKYKVGRATIYRYGKKFGLSVRELNRIEIKG